jgi:hypothetical protein
MRISHVKKRKNVSIRLIKKRGLALSVALVRRLQVTSFAVRSVWIQAQIPITVEDVGLLYVANLSPSFL